MIRDKYFPSVKSKTEKMYAVDIKPNVVHYPTQKLR